MAKTKKPDNINDPDFTSADAGSQGGADAPVVEPVTEAEKKPDAPLPPTPNAQVVYYNSFVSPVIQPCTAFIDSVNKDGSVNLIALVLGEQPPCLGVKSVHYANPGKPGSWNWGL